MFKRIKGEDEMTQKEQAQPKDNPEQETQKDTTATELENLRDILYGNQARQSERQLDEFNQRLSTNHAELKTMLETGLRDLRNSLEVKIATQGKELDERLTAQDNNQKARLSETKKTLDERTEAQGDEAENQLRAAQRRQDERLDAQKTEQTSQLRALQKNLTDRVDALSTDSQNKLDVAQKDLSDRLEKVNETQTQQFQGLQAETRKQDEQLKAELLYLTSMLDGKKVSGQALSNMFIELGHRLQSTEANEA